MKIFTFAKNIFKQFPLLILFNISILIFSGLLEVTSILSLAPVVDLLINPDMQNVSPITKEVIKFVEKLGISVTLSKLLLLFFLFNLTKSMIYILFTSLTIRIRYNVLRYFMLGTFQDFFKAKWLFFSSSKQGTLLNTLLREAERTSDAFWAMANFFAQIIQVSILLVMAFFISWKIMSISLFFAILFSLPFSFLGRLSYRLGQKSILMGNEMSSVIQESLSNAKLILGFGNQQRSVISLSRVFDANRKVATKSLLIAASIPQLYQSLGILVLVVVLISGKSLAVPLSSIVILLYSYYRIIPLLGGIVGYRNALLNSIPGYEQIIKLKNEAEELTQKSGSKIFSSLNHEIALDNISFAYPGHKSVLNNINVRIPKGKMIALVGKSGSGKTTLIDTILGFNDPTSGGVTIDGTLLNNIDIISYRKKIGYVPQDSVIFNMSILDNLRWANEDATDQEIIDACAYANAVEFIDKLPDGYNTIVGDRGVRLSGGQIQRIALARALLRNPSLLILDEATSSLDTHSERLIQKAIENIAKKTTVIVIAHRLSTIVRADYIYIINDGQIAEEGTYSQLIRNDGLFNKMIKLQELEVKIS